MFFSKIRPSATVGWQDSKPAVRFGGATNEEVLGVAEQLRAYGLGAITLDLATQTIVFEERGTDDFDRVYGAVVGVCAPDFRT